MQSIAEQFRQAVSEGSDNGMLIAADALQDSWDETNHKLAELLRAYVNIQTYVRMSQPIPVDMADTFKSLNGTFNTPATRRAGENHHWGTTYSEPLGPYYTKLTVEQGYLARNLDMVSIEPIRVLDVFNCSGNDDLALILRNYRVDYMTRVTLRFDRVSRDTVQIGQAVVGMLGSQLQSLTVQGVRDPRKQVQVMFLSARGIRKGTELFLSASRYDPPARVQIKK